MKDLARHIEKQTLVFKKRKYAYLIYKENGTYKASIDVMTEEGEILGTMMSQIPFPTFPQAKNYVLDSIFGK